MLNQSLPPGGTNFNRDVGGSHVSSYVVFVCNRKCTKCEHMFRIMVVVLIRVMTMIRWQELGSISVLVGARPLAPLPFDASHILKY